MEEKKIQALTADGKLAELRDGVWTVAGAEAPETAENPKAPKAFKASKERSRKFCLTTYIDRESVEAFVASSPWVHHWAMATHDKDINVDTGELKEAHTHILLYTYDAKSSTAVRKIFDKFSLRLYSGTDTPPQNTNIQILRDVVHQWRYLIHQDETEPCQHHYEENERVCDDWNYWHNLELTQTMNASDSNRALAMFDDMLKGTPTRVMIERYGNAFLYHIPHLQKAKELYLAELSGYRNE